MKIIYKYYYLFSITLLLYLLTILKYEINCMEEMQEGKGHFFVWIIRGYTSLSYQVDALKLFFDFSISFAIVFFISFFIKFQIHQYIKAVISIISFFVILGLISFLFISEVYIEKINCHTIYSSFSIGW